MRNACPTGQVKNPAADQDYLIFFSLEICAQGGIGRVAAQNAWAHPLSILGYVLGGLILLVTAAVCMGWKLPFIQDDRQALIAIAILAVAKVADSV
jgi:hypothetical protein